ncbi:hypothetical protein [Prochlorococcus sp. MIT 1303]|uniref:hypothetical protein n=1 Tax=Prochlorococcus sp. MIT 1303 TaxID=1723647 RepID=UPI0007B3E0EF|nr:hypothetical protein [Prochlorococcus sp. MIT 1303]KZR65707.1 hypothetical protein PMIT1303_01156 [Prochlorococcus sp. MIT 1303]
MKRKQAVKKFMSLVIFNCLLLKNNGLAGAIAQALQLILIEVILTFVDMFLAAFNEKADGFLFRERLCNLAWASRSV